jgi:hypothetical protein
MARAKNLPRVISSSEPIDVPRRFDYKQGLFQANRRLPGPKSPSGRTGMDATRPAVCGIALARAGMPAGAVSGSPATWVAPLPPPSPRGRRPCRCGVPAGFPPCLGRVPPCGLVLDGPSSPLVLGSPRPPEQASLPGPGRATRPGPLRAFRRREVGRGRPDLLGGSGEAWRVILRPPYPSRSANRDMKCGLQSGLDSTAATSGICWVFRSRYR